MALNYGYLSSVVRERYMPGFADNIFDVGSLLKILKNDNSVKVKGGDGFSLGLKYAKNQAHGNFSGYDTLDVSPTDNKTRMKLDWVNYYASVSISGDDEDKVQGEEAVLDLVKDGIEDAEMTMQDDLATDIFTGGGGEQMIGLDTAIGTGSYGGINGGTDTWWVSGVDTTAHTIANMKDSTNASYVLALLQTAIRTATHFGKKPNLIVTTLLIWDLIETILHGKAYYTKSNRANTLGQLGFTVLEFRDIPIVADEKCPTGRLYVLNTEFLKMYIHPSRNFLWTGFKEPTNQIARVGQVTTKTQLGLNNRRMFYKFTSLALS